MPDDGTGNKPGFRVRAKAMHAATMDYVRQNVGMAMLIAGTFTLGYAVKNMEDARERQFGHEAECNAKIVSNDALIADQTGRIAEQTVLIKQLQNVTVDIAANQKQSMKLRKTEVAAVTRAASEARAAATVASKGVTAQERQQINAKVKEKAK
jgi:hypothetical protein